MTDLLHEIESSEETESFLKENGEKFQGDALTIMKLLFAGHRLTAQDVVAKYGLHDRRLRDVIKARPDIVKKEWKLNEKGKRMYVEYFIVPFKPPTKEEVMDVWIDKLKNSYKKLPKGKLVQQQIDFK